MGIIDVRNTLTAALSPVGAVQNVKMSVGRKPRDEEPDPAQRELQVITFTLHRDGSAAEHRIALPGSAPLIPTLRTHAEVLAANLALESP